MKIPLNKRCLIVTSLLWSCLFIFSCKNESNKILDRINDSNQVSVFDTILGDKILNFETGEIRKNNFESIIGIEKEQLQFETALYHINRLDSNYFILNQKKSYSDARNFSLLLKTDHSRITDYIVFNDFSITDIKRDSTCWVLLLSDFNQTNNYWKSEQQIQIIKLEDTFNELWRYVKNINIPLNGQSLKVNDSDYTFKIEVITGCSMCFVIAEVVLTKSGEFKSVRSIGRQNSSEIPETELQRLFDEK